MKRKVVPIAFIKQGQIVCRKLILPCVISQNITKSIICSVQKNDAFTIYVPKCKRINLVRMLLVLVPVLCFKYRIHKGKRRIQW